MGSNWLMLISFLFCHVHGRSSLSRNDVGNFGRKMHPPVKLSIDDNNDNVIIDNGIIQVTFSNPQGFVSGIKFNGIDNLLDTTENVRGYWDVDWSSQAVESNTELLKTKKFKIITQNVNRIEISFSKSWIESEDEGDVPLNIDKRYVIKRGVSGIYMYGILERPRGWPAVNMDQIRIVFKLQHKFNFMAISDDKQRLMPSAKDRDNHGKELDYKEAVLLINPTNSKFKGEVDDKYAYSQNKKDDKLHGWISNDGSTGFWMIMPSEEYRAGGPLKQDLTCHTGPIALAMFTSAHYAGTDMNTKYEDGEAWKKVFGPVFVYLNSQSPSTRTENLWTDASRQTYEEVQKWPYKFIASEDFPIAKQRGLVTGTLHVKDRYISESSFPAPFAYVGLAASGDAGSWETETKGYQFWTQTDKNGFFRIKNIRPGTYSLYGWVPGFIGDFKYDYDITVPPGSIIKLHDVFFKPLRTGPTLWEIGYPDRTASEFYIPNPSPNLQNYLYYNHTDKFRQYGLWKRYTDLYPSNDLVFTIGESDYKTDWFFAHVPRIVGQEYEATTWQIKFELQNVIRKGSYTLRLALASANEIRLQVHVNNMTDDPVFYKGRMGKDNAIARHGIHGIYHLYSIAIPGFKLYDGMNILYLTQSSHLSIFSGLMYDYIRLEGPSSD